MNKSLPRQPLVDWQAAIWAGLIAGLAFFILLIVAVPIFAGGNAWVVIRLLSSPVLGEDIVAPPATFHLLALTVGFSVNLLLSIGFSLLLAAIIHRWGLAVGIIGGALFGLGLYAFNFYTLTFFFPWFYAMRSWAVVIAHVLFGVIAGGVYESLEVETFTVIEEQIA